MARQAVSVGSSHGGTAIADVGETDRFHNQSLQSAEALTAKVEDLEAAIRRLETRLTNVSTGLTHQIQEVEERGDHATRRLAMDVVEMGEALSRRIRAQPAAVATVPVVTATPVNRLTLGLAAALLAALAALGWAVLHRPIGPPQTRPPQPVSAALYAPAAEEPVAEAPRPRPLAPRRHARAAAHRHVVHVKPRPGPAPAPLPDTLPGSGAHSVLGPSPG